MTAIAGTYNDQCVGRALSTMSAALGLSGQLPEDWPDTIQTYEIPNLIPRIFPYRRIRVWHSDFGYFENLRSDLWEYCGKDFESTPDADNWLTGFCYVNEAETKGHCVVGVPWVFEGKPIVSLIFSVELQQGGTR